MEGSFENSNTIMGVLKVAKAFTSGQGGLGEVRLIFKRHNGRLDQKVLQEIPPK